MTRLAFSASPVMARLAQLLCVLVALLPGVAFARDVPALRGHVNDEAGMLSSSAEQALEQKLAGYEQRTQHQFALLTIDSLDGDALEDFSIRVVESWKLGQKGKDDGLLLLIVKSDRKLRVEVGYGLEGDVTDAFSAQVIRRVLTPALRAGTPEQGIDQAFDLLMKKAAGESVPQTAVAPPARRSGRSPVSLLVLVFMVVAFFLLPLFARGGRGRRGGGFFIGGMGGGYGGWGGGSGGGGGWGGGGGGGWSGGGGGFGGGGSSGSW